MLLNLALALVASHCTVERARYALRDDPALTARFVAVESGLAWPAHLALRLQSARSGRAYWFLPADGGSDGRQMLASIADPTVPAWQAPDPDGGARPLGDAEYIGTDADYTLLDRVPRRGDAAPAHFLVPELRELLWYRTPSDQREGSARQFFDLVGCGD
ncbi:hypothetical protein [Xanthomonas bonasiae]|uniref:hypothetical protein n=1 Tax=Xanthomonas bonasiae TaxID=2810351 RepID=UPI001F139F1F|nr:hypothetical protein [Xanthomonas bonasiae]